MPNNPLPPVASRTPLIHHGATVLPTDPTWPDAWAADRQRALEVVAMLKRHGLWVGEETDA